MIRFKIDSLNKKFSETNTRKNNGKSRCPSHSSGLGPTKCLAFGQFNWSDTWNCMERECQEECGQIKFEDLRQTIGTYLKKNKFCEDCGKMVLKAYKMLTDGEWNLHDEDSDECVEEASDTCTCCKGPMYRLKNMLTSCNDQHIHVECKEAVIAHLIGKYQYVYIFTDLFILRVAKLILTIHEAI